MARGDGNGAVDARRGGSEIESQLLGTLPTMDIGRVLVLLHLIDNSLLSSLPVLYWKLRNHAREGHCDHYSTRNQKHQTPTTTELTARDVFSAVSHDKINSQLLSLRDRQYILAVRCSPKICDCSEFGER